MTLLGTYVDRALSARTADRPDFQRMIADSAKGFFDVVLVWKLDRFSHPKIGHIQLEARYYYGLANIYGDSKKDYFGKSNNGTIYVKLAYLFDLLK